MVVDTANAAVDGDDAADIVDVVGTTSDVESTITKEPASSLGENRGPIRTLLDALDALDKKASDTSSSDPSSDAPSDAPSSQRTSHGPIAWMQCSSNIASATAAATADDDDDAADTITATTTTTTNSIPRIEKKFVLLLHDIEMTIINRTAQSVYLSTDDGTLFHIPQDPAGPLLPKPAGEEKPFADVTIDTISKKRRFSLIQSRQHVVLPEMQLNTIIIVPEKTALLAPSHRADIFTTDLYVEGRDKHDSSIVGMRLVSYATGALAIFAPAEKKARVDDVPSDASDDAPVSNDDHPDAADDASLDTSLDTSVSVAN
jgi:hypothetical protein